MRGKGSVMTTRKRTGSLLFVTALALLLVSCGYQLVREKGIFGGDITSLYLSVFKNSTYEPHISEYVTSAFSQELLTTGLFTLNKENSDGYLQGTISDIRIVPVSLNIAGLAIEKNVTLQLDVALYRKNGTFIKRWGLSDTETYRVDNIDAEEYNKNDAITRLAARMARRFSSFLFVDY
ncbi:MAG TPA: LPS assembly lipoprotein LptE [Syntrophorhabdaceae bacterium]|nr:LPS assembly lipoprotein LptE [Syntrophorhabdaceae bacterium]